MIERFNSDGTLYQGDVKVTNKLVDESNLNRQYSQMVIPVTVLSNAASGFEFVVPFDMYITNVEVLCTAANPSGTLSLRRGTTLMSGSAICAVANTVAATTVVVSQRRITQGEVLNVISGGTDPTATRGIMFIKGYRVV